MKKDYCMHTTELHQIEVSEKFLKHINELTKMSIKVYMSLVYLKYKRGNSFYASHYEISINLFKDGDWYGNWFGIRTDQGQYFKAFKQLEKLNLIKRYKSKSINGKPLTNRYEVY